MSGFHRLDITAKEAIQHSSSLPRPLSLLRHFLKSTVTVPAPASSGRSDSAHGRIIAAIASRKIQI
jgi:hypothetical protein